jgi:predicted RNA methylase
MLSLANTGKEDVVFDLGCGDGRILKLAVQEFGAKKAVGYEVRQDLYEQALRSIRSENLEDRIVIFNDNLLKADILEATVITLYLTTSGNEVLRPKLEREAVAGTRIVSHDFEISRWKPIAKEGFDGHIIYLYIAKASYITDRALYLK